MSPRLSLPMALLSFALLTLPACAEPSEPDPPPEEETVVALVDGTPITEAELHETAAGHLFGIRQKEYELLGEALQGMITDRLLAAEAQRRGIEVEALLEQEVNVKVGQVTDEQVNAFYEANKARIDRPRDQVAGEIRQFLRTRQAQGLFAGLVDGLRSQVEVKVMLDPPRAEVAAEGDPIRGAADAPVTIIEFSDFRCGYCGKVAATLTTLLERFGDRVRLVYRDFPLNRNPASVKAAEAARCAGEQDRFWDYHDLLFANQRAQGEDQLKAFAGQLGLDRTAFDTCLDSGRYQVEIMEDFEEGRALGLTGTPAFYVNGIFLSGAQPLERFVQVIDDELTRLGLPVAPPEPAGGEAVPSES